jgi:hypothetical protein
VSLHPLVQEGDEAPGATPFAVQGYVGVVTFVAIDPLTTPNAIWAACNGNEAYKDYRQPNEHDEAHKQEAYGVAASIRLTFHSLITVNFPLPAQRTQFVSVGVIHRLRPLQRGHSAIGTNVITNAAPATRRMSPTSHGVAETDVPRSRKSSIPHGMTGTYRGRPDNSHLQLVSRVVFPCSLQ